MRLALFAEPGDRTALALASGWRHRFGAASLMLRTATELCLAPRWVHRLGSVGTATDASDIGFHDGTSLAGFAPDHILCRITRPVVGRWQRPDDQTYAEAEMLALLLSALTAAGPRLVNRPTPECLAGPAPSPMQAAAALAAGLVPADSGASSSRRHHPPPPGAWLSADPGPTGLMRWQAAALRQQRVTIIGDRALNAPPGLAPACLALARQLSCRLLGIDLAEQADGWRWLGIDPLPLLDARGVAALLDTLAMTFEVAA